MTIYLLNSKEHDTYKKLMPGRKTCLLKHINFIFHSWDETSLIVLKEENLTIANIVGTCLFSLKNSILLYDRL